MVAQLGLPVVAPHNATERVVSNVARGVSELTPIPGVSTALRFAPSVVRGVANVVAPAAMHMPIAPVAGALIGGQSIYHEMTDPPPQVASVRLPDDIEHQLAASGLVSAPTQAAPAATGAAGTYGLPADLGPDYPIAQPNTPPPLPAKQYDR